MACPSDRRNDDGLPRNALLDEESRCLVAACRAALLRDGYPTVTGVDAVAAAFLPKRITSFTWPDGIPPAVAFTVSFTGRSTTVIGKFSSTLAGT